MPARKPAAAIVYDEESIAGSRSDQTEAAIITPAANPVTALPVLSPIPRRKIKTEAEPRSVPRNGTMKRIGRPMVKEKGAEAPYIIERED